MEFYQEVERALTKDYRKKIWRPFLSALKDYKLVNDGDRIAVCISGGKDSMLLAKCMQELKKHTEKPFELEFLVMDPGYLPENRQKILSNAALLDIPVTVFDANIFNYVAGVEKSPCYLCARMRRGHLYKNAQALGCNKIALGHHFDDVIETILMSMLYGAEMKTMMPKLHSTNYAGMELIRPLYLVREADIIAWRNYNGLSFLQCACRFTEAASLDAGISKRQEMKALIESFRRISPHIELNIFQSAHNVNLDTIIGWRQGEEQHSFLDEYDLK